MADLGDREILEMAEARTLVHSFLHNGQSQVWLTDALKVTRRIYGKGAEDRVRKYMRLIWKMELLK
jgi:translation initiation factor IF-1